MSTNDLQTKPIGVFDSGIGGLTVVKAITERLPNENIVYFGDTARVPYGSKSPNVVREYAAQDTDVLVSHNVKMIVVACNTVSSVALEVVQKKANVPVVGVIVPGAKAATAVSQKKRVGVIGTVGTISSNAYTNAIRLFDPSITVFSQACPLFVPFAEEGWLDHKAMKIVAEEYLFPLKTEKIDTLVLGCTHYPLLKNVIQDFFSDGVQLIDSGEAAAKEVEEVLNEKKLRNPSREQPHIEFFVSDYPFRIKEIGERFLGRPMGNVRKIEGF